MGSKQQTAVEWLWDKLLEETETGELRYHLKHDVVKVFEEAIQMEREQIENAYIVGIIHPLEMEASKQAKQYYNDTYGTDKN
jgi:hypothetical protein